MLAEWSPPPRSLIQIPYSLTAPDADFLALAFFFFSRLSFSGYFLVPSKSSIFLSPHFGRESRTASSGVASSGGGVASVIALNGLADSTDCVDSGDCSAEDVQIPRSVGCLGCGVGESQPFSCRFGVALSMLSGEGGYSCSWTGISSAMPETPASITQMGMQWPCKALTC